MPIARAELVHHLRRRAGRRLVEIPVGARDAERWAALAQFDRDVDWAQALAQHARALHGAMALAEDQPA